MNKTEDRHDYGELVTFNNKLTAIAGWKTLKIEVLENGLEEWNSSRIQSSPYESRTKDRRFVLVVTEFGHDTLYIFGRSSVISVLIEYL